MNMADEWDQYIGSDPEFQALDPVTQRHVAHNYFQQKVATQPGFDALPDYDQNYAREQFSASKVPLGLAQQAPSLGERVRRGAIQTMAPVGETVLNTLSNVASLGGEPDAAADIQKGADWFKAQREQSAGITPAPPLETAAENTVGNLVGSAPVFGASGRVLAAGGEALTGAVPMLQRLARTAPYTFKALSVAARQPLEFAAGSAATAPDDPLGAAASGAGMGAAQVPAAFIGNPVLRRAASAALSAGYATLEDYLRDHPYDPAHAMLAGGLGGLFPPESANPNLRSVSRTDVPLQISAPDVDPSLRGLPPPENWYTIPGPLRPPDGPEGPEPPDITPQGPQRPPARSNAFSLQPPDAISGPALHNERLGVTNPPLETERTPTNGSISDEGQEARTVPDRQPAEETPDDAAGLNADEATQEHGDAGGLGGPGIVGEEHDGGMLQPEVAPILPEPGRSYGDQPREVRPTVAPDGTPMPPGTTYDGEYAPGVWAYTDWEGGRNTSGIIRADRGITPMQAVADSRAEAQMRAQRLNPEPKEPANEEANDAEEPGGEENGTNTQSGGEEVHGNGHGAPVDEEKEVGAPAAKSDMAKSQVAESSDLLNPPSQIIARNVTKARGREIVREAGGGEVHPDPEHPKRFMVAKPQRAEGVTLHSGISPKDFVEGAKQIHNYLLGDEGVLKGMGENGKAEIQKARDEFARMGGHAYPALARIGGPDLSAAASRLDASHDYGLAQADAWDAHMKAIAKAHGVPFRDAMRTFGALNAEGRLRWTKEDFASKGTEEGDNAAANVVTTIRPELAKRIQTWQKQYDADAAKLKAMPAGPAREKLAADLETRKRLITGWRNMHADSPFESEADVQKALKSPVVQDLAKYVEHNASPITDALYQASSKRGETDQFGQPIEQPVKNAFFPFHVSLFPSIEEELAPGGKLPTGGNVKNAREKHSVLEKAAKGSGGYVLDADKQLRNMMNKATLPGRHAQLFEAAEKAGVGVTATPADAPKEIAGQPVVRFERKLSRHTPALDEGFYVRQDAADEFRRALAIDKPLTPLRKVGRALSYVQLAGVQDAVSHIANSVANAAEKYVGAGMVPEVGGKAGFLAANSVGKLPRLLDSIGTRMVGILMRDPETMDRLAQMTAEGASQPRHGTPNRADVVGQSGRLVRVVTDAMRLAVHDGYNEAVKQGLLPDSAAGRRDYVNQAGNYYRNSSSVLTTALKDVSISPFITAGIGRVANQARFALGADPGIPTGSLRNNLLHRAAAITTIASGLALVALANYISTGQMRPPGVPHGGLYIGKYKDGRPRYIPVMELTSLPGAERMTGAGAVIQNMERQQDNETGLQRRDSTLTQLKSALASSEVGSKALKSIVGQVTGPFMGPGVSAADIALQGFDPHQQRQVAEPRSAQAFGEAARNMNPMVSSFTDKGDQQEGAWGVLGKLAPRTGQSEADMQAATAKERQRFINQPYSAPGKFERQINARTLRHPDEKMTPAERKELLDMNHAATRASRQRRQQLTAPQ